MLGMALERVPTDRDRMRITRIPWWNMAHVHLFFLPQMTEAILILVISKRLADDKKDQISKARM